MSESVWQKLNEILPENGDKIVLNEPFTITQAEGYPVGRAQEIKEIVRAASPEYDTDVFVCGDELGGINTFRMVYGDLARVENILDKVNYTVELQQNPEMDAKLREAKGHLMDVIDHARNEIGDVILIPQTDIHFAGVKIPVSGLYYVQDGKGEGEYRLMDKDGSALAVQSGKFSEFSVDKIIEDYHSAYVLTLAVREAQIANLVGKGDEISFADGIMVSRDEPVTLKDVVNMVKFENNGELKVIGYRLDDEENRVDLDKIGGLELSGLDDLYGYVKELRETEKVDVKMREAKGNLRDALDKARIYLGDSYPIQKIKIKSGGISYEVSRIEYDKEFGQDTYVATHVDAENNHTRIQLSNLWDYPSIGDLTIAAQKAQYDYVKDCRAIIQNRFDAFKIENGKEPLYVEVTVRFKDDGVQQVDIIKLSNDIDERDDDKVFYNVNGIEGLIDLLQADNGEDFDVIDINDTQFYAKSLYLGEDISNSNQQDTMTIEQVQEKAVKLFGNNFVFDFWNEAEPDQGWQAVSLFQ